MTFWLTTSIISILYIGMASGIFYLDFTVALSPIALLGWESVWSILVFFHSCEFEIGRYDYVEIPTRWWFGRILCKSLFVPVGFWIAFILGVPIAEAAFIAGCILLFIRRMHPEKGTNQVDWHLLVFFAVLFILTGVIGQEHPTDGIFASLEPFLKHGTFAFSLITNILLNPVSFVPALLLLRHAVSALQDPMGSWFTLAVPSTLAGILTLPGLVANLIVAEIEGWRGIKPTFWKYTKSGVSITFFPLQQACSGPRSFCGNNSCISSTFILPP